jgi:hypothetical protein
MSLKAFHLVFVMVSATLGLGFGAWAIAAYRRSGSAGSLWWGVGSLAGTAALIAVSPLDKMVLAQARH